jgi:hypothetical protein
MRFFQIFGKPAFAAAISFAALASLPAQAATAYVISGSTNPGATSGIEGNFISGAGAKLYAYNSRNGTLLLMGPFSGDSALKVFYYLPYSVNFNRSTRQISFIGTTDTGEASQHASIYTIDAGTGKTIRKTPWNMKKLSITGTMISATGG